MIAEVYVSGGNLNIDKPFDYLVPDNLKEKISVGARVRVPFGGGNMPLEAYVVGLKEESSFDSLKSIKSVTDSFPVLSKSAIELCFYMKERYFCTFSDAARVMLPPGIGIKFEEWISLSHGYREKINENTPLQNRLVEFLSLNEGSVEMTQIKQSFGKSARSIVNALIKKGVLEKSFVDKKKAREKTVRLAYFSGEEDIDVLIKTIEKKAPKQAEILSVLKNGEMSVPDIISVTNASRNAVEALFVKGLISYREELVIRNPLEGKTKEEETKKVLTKEQETALKIIKEKKGKPFLIHGVTGSGKTEVYLRVVNDALKENKSVIVLVPEISLTPQMTKRFYDRFGKEVAIIHSALSVGERLDEWNRIRKGEAKVIIGARSAIFAPCERLGAIIIDEEHEQTYKSESSPRYSAIEIAKKLSNEANCPLILASATPSVESYYKAKCGEYTLIEMKNRINEGPLPPVSITDMREELCAGNKTVLGRELAREIQKNLDNKEQTILFLNRRGYSTFVSCRECGYVFSCPQCSVSLTYHKNSHALDCHYCGYSEKVKNVCPKCGSGKVKDFGSGTQKAEEQIQKIFPNARILRMDADTTTGKRAHEKILDKFVNEKYDILLGTQMVSKGLDIENVTLVGVLSADATLNVDNFRAQERAFDLIVQVLGRAGRGKKTGRGIIQTYSPENTTLNLASVQDYNAFYDEEIEFRKAFNYPPMCDIVSIVVSSEDELEARNVASQIAVEMKVALRSCENWQLYGPSPAPIYKIQNRFRHRIWIKCKAEDGFISEIRKVIKHQKTKTELSVVADINPYSMN